MNPEIHYWRYGLRLKGGGGGGGAGANAKSGRRVLEGMLIRVDGGYGCVQPWPEFGDEPLRAQWEVLHGRRERTNLIERAMECARLDGAARGEGRSLFAGLRVPESHATLTGPAGRAEFEKLAAEGFRVVKLKGSRDWRKVLESMTAAASAGLRVRVDFNIVLREAEFLEFVAAVRQAGLGRETLDFVEDPVPYDRETWCRLAVETGCRLALDWLPPGEEEPPGDEGGFEVRVIKPAVRATGRNALPVVFTGAMDHPLGQIFAAYEAARYHGKQLEAGLLTHRLFEADVFTEMLGDSGPDLRLPGGTGLGFDALLPALPWQPLVRQGNRGRPGLVLQNPRDPLAAGLPELETGELGFPTSGSTGIPSVIVHSDDSLEASSRAVNNWLNAGAEDVWLRVLPLFHVGGRQIHTRAELAGSRVVERDREEKWDARQFLEICGAEGITLASLVPAQVFDLLRAGLQPPASLRAVVVGGGALEAGLCRRARDLGWPLLPSYGSTETASMVATARLERLNDPEMPPLELLPGWEGRLAADLNLVHDQEVDAGAPGAEAGEGENESGSGLLELRGRALAGARLIFDGNVWQRTALRAGSWPQDGGEKSAEASDWWRTSDRVFLSGRELRFAGRVDRVVKVLGELVNLSAVEGALVSAGLAPGTFAVLAVSEARRGNELVLVSEGVVPPDVLKEYSARAAPFARILRQVPVEPGALPKSALGKPRYREIEKLIPPAAPG